MNLTAVEEHTICLRQIRTAAVILGSNWHLSTLGLYSIVLWHIEIVMSFQREAGSTRSVCDETCIESI